MTDPKHDKDTFEMGASDFALVFEVEDGVDQVLAAIGWLERTEPAEWGRSEAGRAMVEAVRNAPGRLVADLEALIQDGAMAFKDGDPDLAETVTVEAWDQLVLRDRLEDLREVAPNLFDDNAVATLGHFDAALDRADLWLEDLDDARVQMGVEQGKADRRWWRPREDFGSPEWRLPAAAHPDNWVPSEEEIVAWQNGELAPLKAAAVSKYMARLEPPVVIEWKASAAGHDDDGPPGREPPAADVVAARGLAPGVEVVFMSLHASLDTLRVDLAADAGGVLLVMEAGEQRPFIGFTPRIWWLGQLGVAALAGARVVVFGANGDVVADASLGSLPETGA